MIMMAGVIFSLIAIACVDMKTKPGTAIDTTGVPAQYRALYSELGTKLNDLDKTIKSQWNRKKADTKFGVELLVANSNRGEILLTDRVFNATKLTLNRLQNLGVRSVAVSIQYPMLTRSFPRFTEYIEFYRRVAWEIRKRGFGFIVEIGAFFREPEFTKIKVDYSNLTIKTFKAQLRAMVEIIIEDLRPDYLTIFTEPTTQAKNTGLDFSVSNFADIIQHVVDGLSPKGVRLGAGAGTWEQFEYFTVLMPIPGLDYIDMHIYPIQGDLILDRVTKIARQAKRYQKDVSIGETWLYKVSINELRTTSWNTAFGRDVYSFWQPLDSLFIEVLVNLSHQVEAEFCSFFWMKYLYGYMDYNSQTRTLRPQQLINKMDAIAGLNILNNTLNKTGEKFKTLVTAGQ
jgi:hypothetical protein